MARGQRLTGRVHTWLSAMINASVLQLILVVTALAEKCTRAVPPGRRTILYTKDHRFSRQLALSVMPVRGDGRSCTPRTTDSLASWLCLSCLSGETDDPVHQGPVTLSPAGSVCHASPGRRTILYTKDHRLSRQLALSVMPVRGDGRSCTPRTIDSLASWLCLSCQSGETDDPVHQGPQTLSPAGSVCHACPGRRTILYTKDQ
ncbi:uncharacterized protein LOC118478962 [Aplysia californica]|uniref:Uncharacterized protein LOC118478962 n=1 Tax=Aplysia californica TaxID=6500 RepID=A0ABM1W413_APLCA|nr:uncharacterized protein LOC118478962 [Aplysia californica]